MLKPPPHSSEAQRPRGPEKPRGCCPLVLPVMLFLHMKDALNCKISLASVTQLTSDPSARLPNSPFSFSHSVIFPPQLPSGPVLILHTFHTALVPACSCLSTCPPALLSTSPRSRITASTVLASSQMSLRSTPHPLGNPVRLSMALKTEVVSLSSEM